MSSVDPNYRSLLLHLQNTSKNLHPGVPPTLALYLSTLPQPLPTTLSASAIASPAWNDSNISSLVVAFRRSVHLKVDHLLDSSTTGYSLSPSPSWKLRNWIHSICKGLHNGSPKLRFVALGGLLIGITEVTSRLDAGGARSKVEDEVVISYADCIIDVSPTDPWLLEFRSPSENKPAEGSLLLLASDILPLVPSRKLRVLDLPLLLAQCIDLLMRMLGHGHPLKDKKPADIQEAQTRIPRVAHLASKIVESLSENSNLRTNVVVWKSLESTVDAFSSMATGLLSEWSKTNTDVASEDEGKKIWNTFKTILFATIMVLQAVIDSLLFLDSTQEHSNARLASEVIKVLGCLSFISIKFGGLSAQGESSFREYKRTFYTALDIVIASPPQGRQLVNQLSEQRRALCGTAGPSHPAVLALSCFLLQTAEQLIDQLSVSSLTDSVLPICQEYIQTSTDREAFESAHSVMIALLNSGKASSTTKELVPQLVPFYVEVLINCSKDGMLSTEQLRLAFAALVSGAASMLEDDNGALAWYCIEELLESIRERNPNEEERHLRLLLSLVSLISSAPTVNASFKKLLDTIGTLILEENKQNQRVLIKAVYEEILRNVGDAQRSMALEWWYSLSKRLEADRNTQADVPFTRSEL